MRKTKEVLICDRCKKEVNDLNDAYDSMYCYELCEECKKDFDEYRKKTKSLEEKFTQLQEEYKFGKFLFKEKYEKTRI